MSVFERAVDDLFADPNIARAALWRAGGVGDGIPVRVVTRRPDQAVGFGDSRAILPTMLIEVRRAEVASPAVGDVVTIEGDSFEIIAAPTLDSLRLVWTCESAPSS
jgi:hypothetical protein